MLYLRLYGVKKNNNIFSNLQSSKMDNQDTLKLFPDRNFVEVATNAGL